MWIAISAIIIPSAISLVAAYWQVKAMRAMADPNYIPPQKLKRFRDWFKLRLKVFGYPILIMVLPFAALIRELTAIPGQPIMKRGFATNDENERSQWNQQFSLLFT